MLTDDFPIVGWPEFDLAKRAYLRLSVPPAMRAYRVDLKVGLRASFDRHKNPLSVTALLDAQPIQRTFVHGDAGEVITMSFRLDAITAVEIAAGEAALIEACVFPVATTAALGWKPLSSFPAPMGLPVEAADYPCASKPATAAEALEMARGRIRHGEFEAWSEARLAGLNKTLHELVEGGPPPAGAEMVDRGAAVGDRPRVRVLRPLDLILFAAVDPGAAQLLGLYWVDETAQPGKVYDYLVLADHVGPSHRPSSVVLEEAIGDGFAETDAWITYELARGGAPSLAAPDGARVYALPGAATRGTGTTAQPTSTVGLRWDRDETSRPALRAVGYHLWRAELGADRPSAQPPDRDHELLTKGAPFYLSTNDTTATAFADWPPFSLHAFDEGLADGWYAYRVSAIDLFGRYSENTRAAAWYQWSPAPQPRPWYYLDPGGHREIHPFAVRLLDRTAPPPPAGVEATVLDPADPTILDDDAHRAWRESLVPASRESVVGLRIRWRWTPMQQLQAPDVTEFRIYTTVGRTLPTPDPRAAPNWDRRLHVVPFDQVAELTADDDGGTERRYDVLLPTASNADGFDIELSPSVAEPVAYGWAAVSAADGKIHAPDDPTWSDSPLGNRPGNESRLSVPSRIHRIHRTPPAPPGLPPVDGDEIVASAVDFHHRSFFSFRWSPEPHLRMLVYRALDQAVYSVDHLQRPLPPLSGSDADLFPRAEEESAWTPTKRGLVAAELNALNETAGQSFAEARSRYLDLSNDAKRILAGLPSSERAFVLRTEAALDPSDPSTFDRAGRDDPAGYTPQPTLRVFVDAFSGRSDNHYFYRGCQIDGAHNHSRLGLATPPVVSPDVSPTSQPHTVTVKPGDREVVLRWRFRQDMPDVSFDLFRSGDADAALDTRLMERVAQVHAVDARLLDGIGYGWTDTEPPLGVPLYYRVVAIGPNGVPSAATRVVVAQAFDDSRPDPPQIVGTSSTPGGLEIAWQLADPAHVPILQRRDPNVVPPVWSNVTRWLGAGTESAVDSDRQHRIYIYRVRVRDASGRLNRDSYEMEA